MLPCEHLKNNKDAALPRTPQVSSLVWMIFWHIPMFFMYAIDQLGAKLYEPHETNEDWIEAHRYVRTNVLEIAQSDRLFKMI